MGFFVLFLFFSFVLFFGLFVPFFFSSVYFFVLWWESFCFFGGLGFFFFGVVHFLLFGWFFVRGGWCRLSTGAHLLKPRLMFIFCCAVGQNCFTVDKQSVHE